ncbi:galactokinase [Embleya sp. NBC_00896]|uniref:galactokinase n=1 Tax=Embleya sp. NBC_00896 TaxID=2975961 RepID=UPI003870BD9B|nr:galactokinase [Embleya sp. NBC_00896]
MSPFAVEGVWAAPGRVNVIGEHTDYNNGFVLPMATPHTARASVGRRADGRLRLASTHAGSESVDVAVADLAPGALSGWAAYPAGVLWALRDAGHDIGGADIHIDSDVPVGAGLSSSAALSCVVALALNDLYELGCSRVELARIAQRVETDFVGVPVGMLDQMASLCCTAGHAFFLDCRDLTGSHVPFDCEGVGLRLLVIDTRAKHALVDGGYADRRASCEEAARLLGVPSLREVDDADAALAALPAGPLRNRVRHVLTENERVLRVVAALRAGDVRGIGPDLTASHASMRDDYTISCAELDTAVDTALAAGALGARLVGGGFGGSVIALTAADRCDAVAEAVEKSFAARGFTAPRFFGAIPSAGARRVD